MENETDTKNAHDFENGAAEGVFEDALMNQAEKAPKNTPKYEPKTPLFEGSFYAKKGPSLDPSLSTSNSTSSEIDDSQADKSKPIAADRRSKSSLRIKYEAEVQAVKKTYGDLEDIRRQLRLSKRKMAQLLLVDPSAWTRWTSEGGEAPPHIYRTLQWYLLLQEKHPEFKSSVWLNSVATPQMSAHEVDNLKKSVLAQTESEIKNLSRGFFSERLSEEEKLQKELKKSQAHISRMGRRIKWLMIGQAFLIACFFVVWMGVRLG